MPDDKESMLDEIIGDLPPSAKLVAKVLEYEGSMSQSEISDRARLHRSTTRYALNQLIDEEVVEVRASLSDKRQLIYEIRDVKNETD